MRTAPSHFPAPRHRRRGGVRACLLGAMLLVPLACARDIDRPDVLLPERDPSDPINQSANPGVDTRTIDRTGDAPAGPVSPTGDTPGEPEPPPSLLSVGGGQVLAADEGAPARAASATGSGYRTIGGILAEVNGRPIYSDEVIAAVRNPLRGAAQGDRGQFLASAKAILKQELDSRIKDELFRVVAERNLSRSDRQRATAAATQYRLNLITAAGGSEARARQQALDDAGMTLDRLVAAREREFLIALFAQQVITPRVTPSAEEVRGYYLRHRNDFSNQGRGEIEFAVIELAADGPLAKQNAERLQQLAAGGADFEQLAREHNDNPFYRESGGKVPGMPLGRGDFRWAAVDQAAWDTPEGGVTPVIADDNGRRLFIAKVIRKQVPEALGFGDVQRQISQSIAHRRQMELMRQYDTEAGQYAVVTPPDQIARNLQTALEVVSEQYEALRGS